jgi:hypothetical protein
MSGAKRFQCTACGKCCYGSIPLTYKDAVAFAGLFPLAMVWTPVRKGSKDFKMAKTLGASIPLPNGIELASLIVPTAFIPGSFPCPALADQKACGIHRGKPSRCKTMPFYPYRDEKLQGDFLKPRQGWECDTSDEAPLVYEDGRILMREDFDMERSDLLEQVPILRRYAEYMLKYTPSLPGRLSLASVQEKGGQIVTSLSSLLTALRHPDAEGIALKQTPLLEAFANRTAGHPDLAEYHAYYTGWAKEMAFLSQKRGLSKTTAA